MTGRCIGCRAPGGAICGGCGADLRDDEWDGTVKRRVVVCGSSRLAPEIASVAVGIAKDEGVRISVPDFTSEQPTDGQVKAWNNCILNADEVVVVCDDTYTFGDHVRGEIYTAHMGGVPVRLVNGELESK